MMLHWAKRGIALAVLIGCALAGMTWVAIDAGANEAREAREIVLVAREMAFFVQGDAAANPTLLVRPGERIRIVLRNEEPGVTHNFAVPGWDVATRELYGTGTDAVEFIVPPSPGRQEYQCAPHATMMRGAIEVR